MVSLASGWRFRGDKLLRASMEVASRVVVISRPERIVAGLVGWVRGLQRRGRIRESLRR